MPHAEQTALINGRIHTPMGMAEALLIEAGRIAAVGTTATIGLHCDTRLIDLGGLDNYPTRLYPLPTAPKSYGRERTWRYGPWGTW